MSLKTHLSIVIGLSLSLLAACNTASTATRSTAGSASTAPASSSIEYHEVMHDGRLYVLGSAESYAAFKESHHMPYTRTLIGDGLNGETTVIEINKKDDNYNEALFAAYRARHPFYREVEHDGRLYVIGNEDTYRSFIEHHHLPYTRTLIGKGPKGQTLVIEIDKDNSAVVDRLETQYESKHGSL